MNVARELEEALPDAAEDLARLAVCFSLFSFALALTLAGCPGGDDGGRDGALADTSIDSRSGDAAGDQPRVGFLG